MKKPLEILDEVFHKKITVSEFQSFKCISAIKKIICKAKEKVNNKEISQSSRPGFLKNLALEEKESFNIHLMIINIPLFA